MKKITLANYDNDNIFAGIVTLPANSLSINNKIYLPANSTDILPPTEPLEGFQWQWNNGRWIETEIPATEVPIENTSDITPESTPNLSPEIAFLLNVVQSQLYQLGKYSTGQARVEFEEVKGIINGQMIFIPQIVAENGLLQKNLQEMIVELGTVVTQETVDEFNSLLFNDLGVSWQLTL